MTTLRPTRNTAVSIRLLLPCVLLLASTALAQDDPDRPAPEPPPVAPEPDPAPAATPETPEDRPGPEAAVEEEAATPPAAVFGEGGRPDRRPVKDELVTLNLKDVNLEDLFDFIAIETGKVVMPIGQRIGGATDEYTIIADEPLPRSQALDLIFSYMRMNDIGIIEQRNVIFIGKLADMREELGEIEVVPPSASVADRQDRGTLILKIFQVRQANAETIVGNLENFFPAEYAKISGDSLSNQILLLGDVGLAQQAEKIITEQDHLWLDEHIRTYRLRWADATEVEEQIITLFEDDGSASGSRSGSSRNTQTGRNGQRSTPRTPTSAVEGRQRVPLRTTVSVQQNAITVEAEKDVIVRITELIDTQWDLPRPEGTSRLFILKYTDPIKVRDLLQTVLGAGGGSSTSSGRSTGGRSNQQGSADATAGISGVYNIEAFPDRNALLVLAKTVEAFDFIESVIAEVDKPSDVGLPEVIPLKYANAVELSEEINILLARAGARVSLPRPNTELTAEGFSASGDSGGGGINISGPDTGGSSQDLNFPWQTGGNDQEQAAESALIGKVRVVPITRQNALAILAPPAYRDSMVRLIHTFDRPRRQVMLSATIVEVELGDNLNLGVKMGNGVTGSGNGVFAGSATLSGAANGAVPIAPTDNPIQYFIDNIFAGTNAIISAGPFDVNLIIEALNTVTNTRVLQEPRVYTADNEEAVFFSGLEYPVVSSITDSASAGLNTQTSVEYKNVGVFLNVRPRITEEGAVDLTVTLELSAVGPSATISGGADGTVNSQIFTRKQVSSHVILLDGQTVVIGGLLKETESALEHKIPLLGDLPLIGSFFQHKEESLERTELIAFLTPTVVHRPFDNYSNFNVDDLERLEAVAQPLDDQLRDASSLIDLNVFERITRKANIELPDEDPTQLDIDEDAPDTSLLRRLTPQDAQSQDRTNP